MCSAKRNAPLSYVMLKNSTVAQCCAQPVMSSA